MDEQQKKYRIIKLKFRCFILTLGLIMLWLTSQAIELKTIPVDSVNLCYHLARTSQPGGKGLVIFLHGAVSQFQFSQPKAVPVEELLEGNDDFLQVFNRSGYDVLLPVAYNAYNWLNDGGKKFIEEILHRHSGNYSKIFIAGFSDGATGSYRYFYENPALYDGLIMFNGYPQLGNFHKSVDYLKVRDKQVLFFSTTKDKRIPYEFILVEYRRQKMVNAGTYFTLREGSHTFTSYDSTDFYHCISYLEIKNKKPVTGIEEVEIYAPVDGLMVEGKLLQLYPFRKKIARQFGMQKTEYKNHNFPYKTFQKLLRNSTEISFLPARIAEAELKEATEIKFEYIIGGHKAEIKLPNYLNLEAW